MIYVASSWRNKYQPDIIKLLLQAGVPCYDFHNPPGNSCFAWSSIDPEWQKWDEWEFGKALLHPLAIKGFHEDMTALRDSSAVLLVLPSGRSAHLEAGWGAGAGKPLGVFCPPDYGEPELMLKMAEYITNSPEQTAWWCKKKEGKA